MWTKARCSSGNSGRFRYMGHEFGPSVGPRSCSVVAERFPGMQEFGGSGWDSLQTPDVMFQWASTIKTGHRSDWHQYKHTNIYMPYPVQRSAHWGWLLMTNFNILIAIIPRHVKRDLKPWSLTYSTAHSVFRFTPPPLLQKTTWNKSFLTLFVSLPAQCLAQFGQPLLVQKTLTFNSNIVCF